MEFGSWLFIFSYGIPNIFTNKFRVGEPGIKAIANASDTMIVNPKKILKNATFDMFVWVKLGIFITLNNTTQKAICQPNLVYDYPRNRL